MDANIGLLSKSQVLVPAYLHIEICIILLQTTFLLCLLYDRHYIDFLKIISVISFIIYQFHFKKVKMLLQKISY